MDEKIRHIYSYVQITETTMKQIFILLICICSNQSLFGQTYKNAVTYDEKTGDVLVFGDTISAQTAKKHIDSGKVAILETGPESEASAFAKAEIEANRQFEAKYKAMGIDTVAPHNLILINKSGKKYDGNKYNFRYLSVAGCEVSLSLSKQIKAYNQVVKTYLTSKYGDKWEK